MSATLHLGQGSQQPPKVGGKLRLYSMEYCPYAQRSRLVLNAKNIPHDVVNINLYNKPDWYFKIHAEGKVPALDTGSEILVESLVICDFLDEKYPEPPLYPKDPAAKKRDQELIQKIDDLTKVFYRSVLALEKKSSEEWAKDFESHLDIFQKELATRGKFFGGDKPGMVDYMLWPWGERAPLVALALGQKLPFPKDKFTLLKNWSKAMKEDPAAKSTYNDIQKHWAIVQKRLKKEIIDYNKL